MSDPQQGIRSVVGSLLAHVAEYDIPASETPEYAAFVNGWCDRLMKASGLFREQERVTKLQRVAEAAATAGGTEGKCMGAATAAWRRHHPGNENVMPDLGNLVGWLIDQADLDWDDPKGCQWRRG